MKIKLKENHSKPCIGIYFGNYHSDHPRQLLRYFHGLLSSEDVEVRFYLGTESSSFLTDYDLVGNSYDYQYASFYSLSRFDDLDLLIVSIGTIGIFQDWATTDEILGTLPDVPKIILEIENDMSDGIWLIADNHRGISECVDHLVDEHGLRNILFLAGPDCNFDGIQRLQGYRDSMKKHGLAVEDKMIGHGDYSENVDDVVEALLDANPGAEAIVSANDEMAYSIYRVCEKRGLEVGRDIAVMGFDDAEMSKFIVPPLSTCRQDYEVLSRHAYEKTMALIRGEEAFSEQLQAPLILRGSCGCAASEINKIESQNLDDRDEMLRAKRARVDFQHDVWKGILLMREMIPETADKKEFVSCIGRFFEAAGVRRSYITLFEDPRKIEKNGLPDCPDNMRLFLVQDSSGIHAYGQDDAPILGDGADKTIHDYVEPAFYITFLLYYEKYQYGSLSVEIDPSKIDFFYMISLELGTSFRHLHMTIERERYRAELQALARHDNLTGLYNRLGMAGTAAGYVKINKKRTLVAMMADLDHLKQINDSFGHSSGDTAIIKSASILRKAVGKNAPLGRTGGDEFMSIFAVNSEKDIEKVRKKIRDACAKYNERSDNPFYVEISVGFHSFRAEEYKDLSSVMEPADALLYEAKKNRRSSVLK
ncbi:MAG: GGDEF domain-containing protein [Lachnospiraceae bacterium]|nr:GGDEF domain-containing protein [Lachnospiraceae bacterium]